MTSKPLKRSIRRVLRAAHIEAPLQDLYRRCRYALDRPTRDRNRRLRIQGVPDGLPLPPARFAYAATGTFDLEFYYRGGEATAELIASALADGGQRLEDCRSVLDFGCGAGRVIRHFRELPAALSGCDRNPDLVDWCRQALPFGRFSVSPDSPPLPVGDDSFDLVYAISVFTHIPARLQSAWLDELRRIVRPGKLLLLTTHGSGRRHQLRSDNRERFDRGELVMQGSSEFSNHFGVFHPRSFVTGRFTSGLSELAYVEGERGADKINQDLYLFRTPA